MHSLKQGFAEQFRVALKTRFGRIPSAAFIARQVNLRFRGGQQQQLAIGRAIMANPKVLLLDEPTEGIQPSVIKEIGEVIKHLSHEKGMAVLLVEQYYDFAQSLADAYAVMSRGQIQDSGRGHEMAEKNVKSFVAI